MKFKAGQEVMIVRGMMSGRKAVVISIYPSGLYELEINGLAGTFVYPESLLEAIQ